MVGRKVTCLRTHDRDERSKEHNVFKNRLAHMRLVRLGVHQAIQVGQIGEFHLDDPPLTVGVLVDEGRIATLGIVQGRVEFEDFTLPANTGRK